MAESTAARRSRSITSCSLPAEERPALRCRLVRDIDPVDDADDRCIDGRRTATQRRARGTPFEHHQDLVAGSGLCGVDGEERWTARLVTRRERLHQEQLRSLQFLVLPGRYDAADDPSQSHVSVSFASRVVRRHRPLTNDR